MLEADQPTAPAAGPTAAEWARTTLRLAGPLTAHAVGAPPRRVSLHGTGEDGAPLLVPQVDDPLVQAVRAAPPFAPDVPAIVEALDLYPVSQKPSTDLNKRGSRVRSKAQVRSLRDLTHRNDASACVRSRLWLAGWLTELRGAELREAAVAVSARSPVAELLDVGTTRTVLRLEPGQILLGTGATEDPTAPDAIDVDPEAYAAAVPDLLADLEAVHLAHLVDDHPEALALLCRLLDPSLRQTAVGVTPGRLDRYGLVVRVHTGHGCEEARLPFGDAITHADQLPGAMQALMHRAARGAATG